MFCKTRHTDALETARNILAVSITFAIFTLILVYTLGASLVTFVAPWTDTLVAAECVVTCPDGPAKARLLSTFINISTLSTWSLAITRLTFALKTARRVDTAELTVVPHGCALIKISAGALIHIENISWWTATDEGAQSVGAGVLTHLRFLLTLVHIDTSLPSLVCLVSFVTHTAV